MERDKLALIIPTVNRTEYICRLLESIRGQDVMPDELLVIDGGPADISASLKDYSDMNIRYITTSLPSLTRQRNIGISKISSSATLVGFMDDDIILKGNSLENMLKFWETAEPGIGGASFNNLGSSFYKAGKFESAFSINSLQSGRLLRSGFNTQISSTQDTKYVDWLFGGITVWRRKVVEEFKFDEWFRGNAFGDDVDYSCRVGKKYKLMVVKEAEALHLSKTLKLREEYPSRKAQTENRLYLARKHKEFSLALCYWAHIGLCLKNLSLGVFTMNPRYILRGVAISVALLTFLLKKAKKEAPCLR